MSESLIPLPFREKTEDGKAVFFSLTRSTLTLMLE